MADGVDERTGMQYTASSIQPIRNMPPSPLPNPKLKEKTRKRRPFMQPRIDKMRPIRDELNQAADQVWPPAWSLPVSPKGAGGGAILAAYICPYHCRARMKRRHHFGGFAERVRQEGPAGPHRRARQLFRAEGHSNARFPPYGLGAVWLPPTPRFGARRPPHAVA